MDTLELRSVGGRYYALRGLLVVPTGLLFIAAGLTNMPPIGDEAVSDSAWWFVAVLGLAAAGYLLADRHYASTFGRISPSSSTRARFTVFTVLGALATAIGISVDANVDLPVSAFGVAFAVAWLGYYRLLVGLRPYHWACLGSLGLLSVLPIWGDVDDRVSLAMIPIGLATIVLGLLDHRELVRSIGPARDGGVRGGVDAPV